MVSEFPREIPISLNSLGEKRVSSANDRKVKGRRRRRRRMRILMNMAVSVKLVLYSAILIL